MADIPIPRELVERAPTLYGITGDIKDINTLLIPRSALTQQAEPVPAALPSTATALDSFDDLPGMWERSDFLGGETDCAPATPPSPSAAQPSGEVLTDVRTHITAAMDNDLGWADRMLQMDKARKLIDATLAKIGAK